MELVSILLNYSPEYNIFFTDFIGLDEQFMIKLNAEHVILQHPNINSYKWMYKNNNIFIYTSEFIESNIYLSIKEYYNYYLQLLQVPNNSEITQREFINLQNNCRQHYINKCNREAKNFNISLILLKLLKNKFNLNIDKLIKSYSYYESNMTSHVNMNIYHYMLNMKDDNNHVYVIRFQSFIGKFIFTK